MNDICAYTEPGHMYPGYVNISAAHDIPGTAVITVRSGGERFAGGLSQTQATFSLPFAEMDKLVEAYVARRRPPDGSDPAAEAARLKAMINSPEIDDFLRGVHLEAVHQVERWGTAHDRAKRPADWFWLVGYLAGKALHAAISGDRTKALHHCISTAAALFNWHSATAGTDTRMCPGRSDLADLVDAKFPGEVGEAEC